MKRTMMNGSEESMWSSWYHVMVLMGVALLLAAAIDQYDVPAVEKKESQMKTVGLNNQEMGPPCDELYVVGEGETLYSVANKCGDPFIVERNPHIHDPDDVFPGILIKLIPFNN